MTDRSRPTEIWVGAKPYQVVYDKAAMDAESVKREHRLLGLSQHTNLRIIINNEVPEQILRDTLIHEMLHCLWIDAGMDELESLTEEQIISCLAPRLVSVLRVNPELLKYVGMATE